jgi:chemotaxis protein CheY-P-specific phosphatase CheC
MQVNRHATIEDLMSNGYINAIKSMLTFTREALSFMPVMHTVQEGELSLPHKKAEGAVINLRTDVIGELSGRSHFILSEQEAAFLATHSLKKLNGALHLHEHFLKEMDNIISAAVISKISNSLQLKIYGDVPHLEKWDSWEAFCENQQGDPLTKNRYYCSVIEIYFEHHPQLKPLFVWMLDEKFIEAAKEKGYPLSIPQPLPL